MRFAIARVMLSAALMAIASLACAAREIYLVRGGADLLVLDRSTTGIDVVEPSYLRVYASLGFEGATRTIVTDADFSLTLRLTATNPPPYLQNDAREPRIASILKRNGADQRDYDLLRDDFLVLKPDDPLVPAHRNFLHRLDDPNIIEYFRLAADTPTTYSTPAQARLLTIAAEVVKAHPTDSYARVLYWDALLRNNHLRELDAELQANRAAYENSPVKWLTWQYFRARDELEGARSSNSHRNAYDLMQASDAQSLHDFLRDFPTVLQYPEYYTRSRMLTSWVPNFLEAQVKTKVIRVAATLMLFKGHTDDAFRLLLANYWYGRLMAARLTLIDKLIGTAIRAITIAGLRVLTVESNIESPQLTRYLRDFGAVENTPIRASGSDLATVMGASGVTTHTVEVHTRVSVTDAKAILLRAGMATRLLYLQQHRAPVSVADLAPALNGIPIDPFTSQPLRMQFQAGDNSTIVYSLGVDGSDQRGQIEYDPTNGTISAGDVIQRVNATPDYPFSNTPIHARTAEDVYRQFPRGLPVDPFADTKTRGLGVTNTLPVRIYSFGPDTNQHDAEAADAAAQQRLPTAYIDLCTAPAITESWGSPAQYIPNIPYEPTNGVVSRGDLYTDLAP